MIICLHALISPSDRCKFVYKRALDCCSHEHKLHHEKVLCQGDRWLQEVLMYGHGGSMYAVAWHPVRSAVFATACEAPRVFVLDATARSVTKTAATNMASRAVAWSSLPLRDGTYHHLALGGAKGRHALILMLVLHPTAMNCKTWDDSVMAVRPSISPTAHPGHRNTPLVCACNSTSVAMQDTSAG
jgi:hypothetical protein